MVSIAELQQEIRGTMQLSVPLAPYTNLGIGGPADYFFTPADEADHERILNSLAGVPHLLFRENMLVHENGFRGAIICMSGSLSKEAAAGLRGQRMFKEQEGVDILALIQRARVNHLTWGGAQVIDNQIVNTGSARAGDILSLVTYAQRRIQQVTGTWMELDFPVVGFAEVEIAA